MSVKTDEPPVLRWKSPSKRLQEWWHARHTPRERVSLHQHNLYILPTRAGCMLAFTLLILLTASINYQLNLGYLLTFLITACAAASTWACHRNMLGLELHAGPAAAVFSHQSASVKIAIYNSSRRWRYALNLAWVNTTADTGVFIDSAPQTQDWVTLIFTPTLRGWHKLPLLRMQTHYPLGVFRVWTLWRPTTRVLVYPQAEAHPPPLPDPLPANGSRAMPSRVTPQGELDGVRPYRRGDPLKWVAWKKVTSNGELVSRDASSQHHMQLWLDLSSCKAMHLEASLQRLCAWVLKAEAAELSYGLRLPGLEIQPSHGSEHRNRCLEALALC